MRLFGLSFRRRQPWQKNPADYCLAQSDINAWIAEDRAQFQQKMALGLQVCAKSESEKKFWPEKSEK